MEESPDKITPLSASSKLHELTIKEEDEEEDEGVEENKTIKVLDESKQSQEHQETTVYEDVCYQLPEDTSKSIVMKVCRQTEPMSFEDILYDEWVLYNLYY